MQNYLRSCLQEAIVHYGVVVCLYSQAVCVCAPHVLPSSQQPCVAVIVLLIIYVHLLSAVGLSVCFINVHISLML